MTHIGARGKCVFTSYVVLKNTFLTQNYGYGFQFLSKVNVQITVRYSALVVWVMASCHYVKVDLKITPL
jgi:hypothetical protein